MDTILYEQNLDKMCQQISKVSSSIILHAIVNHYNWDDGPESMIAALNNPVCAVITFMEMFELMEGDYWLKQTENELDGSPWKQQWKEMAEKLKVKLEL
ncbi:DUF4274 domain-containing protein [Lysinibacillus sp. FSL R7-0073]|uniref:DUF4274 domain-containing protein n=1 Tax=Lysinibacillus sp. FSL R7-0073 TaxID=2921669 RepID=UPI0030F54CA7